MASDLPSFENLDDEKLARIKASLGIVAAEAGIASSSNSSVTSDTDNVVSLGSERSISPKRRRGIRRNPAAPVTYIPPIEAPEPEPVFNPVPAAQTFSRRDEREVAERLQNLFTSLTGMPAVVSGKLYLQMTDEEAQNIAKPLASYLIRNEPTQVIAREILDNYDLLAIVVGVMAYVVRVYRDRSTEVAEREPKPAARQVADRISEHQERNLGGQESGDGSGEFSFPTAIPWNGPGL